MSRRSRRRGLNFRTEQAATAAAVTAVPTTFQRSLMPRSDVDQALVTGLTLTADHAIVGLVQDSIAALALALVADGDEPDDRRWGRATLALDLVTLGAGLAVQRAAAARPREPMARSAVRTGAWFAGVSAAGGALVGVLQEVQTARGRTRRFPVGLPLTVVATAYADFLRSRRERLDTGLPPQETQVDAARALALSLGVTGAGFGFSAATRAVADVVAGGVSRVLPGSTSFWRPVGRAAVLAGVGAGVRMVGRRALAGIERKEESFEAAFDLPPPVPEVSGSFESLVPFETMARQGRRFVWNVVRPDAIEETMGEPAVASPIRAYVGLESAPDEDARVALAMAELERTGAFERSWLMFASPTGTGYVNYAAVGALELLSRGDCATVSMQYSARPSVLSLDRIDEGSGHAAKLIPAIGRRLARIPESRRPRFVLFGESLGAWTSQDAFVDRGTDGLREAGVDRAIWIGTPHMSKWKEQVLHDTAPHIDRTLIGVYDDIAAWAADDRPTGPPPYVMITHDDDGVALFGPELFLRAPEWLGPPESRPARVPRGMRWAPTTTFFQGLVDMKNSATVVPGQFDAKGHDYRRDLVPFFDAVLGFGRPPELVEAAAGRLETQELNRARWIESHTAAGSSLAAAVAIRWMQQEREAGRDPDAALEASVRALVAELGDAPEA